MIIKEKISIYKRISMGFKRPEIIDKNKAVILKVGRCIIKICYLIKLHPSIPILFNISIKSLLIVTVLMN